MKQEEGNKEAEQQVNKFRPYCLFRPICGLMFGLDASCCDQFDGQPISHAIQPKHRRFNQSLAVICDAWNTPNQPGT